MTKSISAKSLSILLALTLLCSMGLITLVLSSPSTAGAQPWSMYFVQTYIIDDSEYGEVWISIMDESQTVTDIQITSESDMAYVSDPSVAIAPDGNIIVAWESLEASDSDDQIHYAVLDSSGAVVRGNTALTSNTDGNYEVCVAVTPDGKVFVVWERNVEGDDPISYAILDTTGNILSTQTSITGSEDMDDPTVGTSTKDATNNNVVIAWEEDNGSGYNEVWFTILNSTGDTMVAKTQVTTNGVDSDDVNVAVLPGGNFAIVWEEDDGSDEQVWFTIYGSNGSIVKENTKLTTSEANSDDPGVAATPGGNIVIVWSEPVPDEYDNVFYAILNSSGNVVKAIAEVTTSSLDDDDCDVAIDRNGNIVISWEDWRGETDRVSFAILTSGGTIVATDLALTDGTYDISLDNEEGRRQVATKPTPLRPVGGEAFSPDKMVVMAPWIALSIAITIGTGILVRRRRTAN